MSQKKQAKEAKSKDKKKAKTKGKPPEKIVEPKKQKKKNEAELPLLVEFVISFSGLALILVSLIVAGVSFTSGANIVQLVLRTGTTIVVLGCLLLLVSSRVASGALEAALTEDSADQAPQKGSAAQLEHVGQDIKA